MSGSNVLRPMTNTPDRNSNIQDKMSQQLVPTLPQTPTKAKRTRDFNTENLNGVLTPPNSIKKKMKLIERTPIESYSSLLPSPTKTPSPQKLVFGKQSIYSRTKALLQKSSTVLTNQSGCLLTRQVQHDKIMHFLNNNIENHQSNSLYITGPPGTGKTAQLDAITKNKFLTIPLSLSNHKDHNRKISNSFEKNNLLNTQYFELPNGKTETVNISTINCIAIKDPTSIFTKIYESFATEEMVLNKTSVKTMADLQKFMESYSNQTTFVIILDEMDKLVRTSISDTHATRIIFELFLLARLPTINFLLIGVANSLDMKDKFLSRLNLRQDLLPSTIVFNPYTSEEMYQIITDKINTVEPCVFNPVAIRFAAKKCSGNTGDLRRLLDVLRHSIEIVELESVASIKRKGLKSINNDDSDTIKKVGMQHIAKVFTTITNVSSTRARIGKINMQQRILLCVLVQRENTDIFQSSCTLDEAFSYYVKLLHRRNIFKPLNRNEFLEMCNTLETCSLINISNGRSSGKTKHIVKLVKTTVDKTEFTEEMNKTEILKNFITI